LRFATATKIPASKDIALVSNARASVLAVIAKKTARTAQLTRLERRTSILLKV
jgi:hypothetical protein